jgi:hypothetical protein
MVTARLTAFLLVLGATAIPARQPASALDAWMSQDAQRKAFIGKTLDGYYATGVAWTETYLGTGRLDYHEQTRKAVGYWYFRGDVFCTFYDPPHDPVMMGGCWLTIKTSANCYELYLAGLDDKGPSNEGAPEGEVRWNARAWRQDEPSTCSEKPIV